MTRSVAYVVHESSEYELSGTPLIADQMALVAKARGYAPVYIITPHTLYNITSGIRRRLTAAAASQISYMSWARNEYSVLPEKNLENLPALDVIHVVDEVLFSPLEIDKILADARRTVRSIWNAEDFCAFIEPLRRQRYQAACSPSDYHYCAACISGSYGFPRSFWAGKKTAINKKNQLQRMFNRYDVLTTATEEMQGYLAKVSAELCLQPDLSKLHVIRHGTATATLQKNQVATGAKTRLSGVFLGPFSDRKGGPSLIKAIASLEDSLLDRIDFVLYGVSASDMDKIPESIRRSISIRPPFGRNELPMILSAADFGIVASPWETWCRAGFEFLAAKIPVLTTPVFGLGRFVAETGAGITTSGFTPDAIAGGLRQMAELAKDFANIKWESVLTRMTTPEQEFQLFENLYFPDEET